MSGWMQLLFVLTAVAIIFWIISIIRNNPGSFTFQNINKSITTMCILTLLLIGFMYLLVVYLRH